MPRNVGTGLLFVCPFGCMPISCESIDHVADFSRRHAFMHPREDSPYNHPCKEDIVPDGWVWS